MEIKTYDQLLKLEIDQNIYIVFLEKYDFKVIKSTVDSINKRRDRICVTTNQGSISCKNNDVINDCNCRYFYEIGEAEILSHTLKIKNIKSTIERRKQQILEDQLMLESIESSLKNLYCYCGYDEKEYL